MKRFFKSIWNCISALYDTIVLMDALMVGFCYFTWIFSDIEYNEEMQKFFVIAMLLLPIFVIIYALKSLITKRDDN